MNRRHVVLLIGLSLPLAPTVWGQDATIPVDTNAAVPELNPAPDTPAGASRLDASRRNGGQMPPPQPDPQPLPAEDSAIIKVFMLKYVDASTAASTLTELLPGGKFVADVRVNAIIARGEAERLEMAEALLLQLDAEPAIAPRFGSSGLVSSDEPEPRAKVEEVLRSLRGKYETTEQRTQSIAEALVAERDAEATKRLREQLTIVVAEAFGLRQELQRAELALLRERIHRIESQVNQRETLRDAIIKHRVDQLVQGQAPSTEVVPEVDSGFAPAARPTSIPMQFDQAPWREVLQSFADVNGVALQLDEAPPGTFSYRSSRQHSLEQARAAINAALPSHFEMLQNEGQLIVRQRTEASIAANIPATGVTTLRKPNDYRLAFEDVHAAIAKFEVYHSRLKEQANLDADGLLIRDTLPKLKKQLETLTAEHAAQIRLFELELGAAKVAVETTTRALERVTALFESGRIDSTELGQAKLAHEQARVRFDQMQTLLDLYRQAGTEAPAPPTTVTPESQTPIDGSDSETSSK